MDPCSSGQDKQWQPAGQQAGQAGAPPPPSSEMHARPWDDVVQHAAARGVSAIDLQTLLAQQQTAACQRAVMQHLALLGPPHHSALPPHAPHAGWEAARHAATLEQQSLEQLAPLQTLWRFQGDQAASRGTSARQREEQVAALLLAHSVCSDAATGVEGW